MSVLYVVRKRIVREILCVYKTVHVLGTPNSAESVLWGCSTTAGRGEILFSLLRVLLYCGFYPSTHTLTEWVAMPLSFVCCMSHVNHTLQQYLFIWT